MVDMFANYDYIPSDYTPNNQTDKIVANRKYRFPNEEYNAKGEVIGLSWNANENINLEFYTNGYVKSEDLNYNMDAETFLSDKKFKITFFNFRFEVIHQEDGLQASTDFKYYISDELKKKLIPNTYSIQVDVTDNNGYVIHTLIDRRDLKIFVR